MKHCLKITSVFLVTVSLFVTCFAKPALAVAEYAQEQENLKEYLSANDFSKPSELSYSPLVGEDVSRRTADQKTFRRADGAMEAVVYPFQVHFEKDGAWTEIDNTLQAKAQEDGSERISEQREQPVGLVWR